MAQGEQLPGRFSDISGFPSHFQPIIWEKFTSLNTKPLRPAIEDGEAYILDGWMPLGPSNLRTLPGTGPNIYTAPNGMSVIWYQFYNIFDTEYCVVLLNDGSLIQINLATLGTTAIGGGGTISSPSTVIGFSQWGSQYLILSKDQPNGYWLWDGTNLFTAGTLGPQVNIDNSGQNYTGTPTIFTYTTGSGSGQAFSPVITDGAITQILVTNPGSGYAVDDFIAMNISGGGTDSQAYGTPIVTPNAGGVSGVIILQGQGGYTGRAFMTFHPVDGNGSGAQASIAIVNGVITAVSMINEGTGYTAPPTPIVNDPGDPVDHIPPGSGFSGQSILNFGQITGVTMNAPGSGYGSLPTVTFIGDGTAAAGTAQITNGGISGIVMTNYGSGYSKALMIIEGGNNAANGTPFLMPFGVSGTTVETYQARVWVSNGSASSNTPPKNRTLFSSPQNPVDFGDGGGVFQSFDSFLRVGYHSLKQANGFLYLIGDSSMNYLSSVTTTNSSSANTVATPITTINNQNVDPQIGTPWPASVQVFSRNIVFANSIGIFASTGGALEKISTPLDGFYASGPIFGIGSNFSSAIATIFGTSVYMLLLPVVDQFTGQLVNKLLMWDGRRLWTSQQDRNLSYIAAQELNSVLTAYGTDGSAIFPLFNTPSTGFQKVAQSKLFSDPAYFMTKTARSLSGIAFAYAIDDELTITIDSETGAGSGDASVMVLPANAGVWVNEFDVIGEWVNQSAVPGEWDAVSSLTVFGPEPIGQNGRLIGMTVQTNASNVALLSLMLSEQVESSNV